MTALDNIKAALEAGPQVLITDGYYGACNPSAIRELLAYVESLEKDAGRYQKLRNAKTWPTKDNEFIAGICVDSWDESGSGTQLVGDELDAAVDAIDAAMEQTK